MSRHFVKAAFLFNLVLTTLSSLETASSTPNEHYNSLYDALKAYGLPMGLFPKGVKDFKIDYEGRFEAYLEQDCSCKFENELHYDRIVSGQLNYGFIRNLTGISAQDLFLWFPVLGIRVDIPSSGLIYFDVGVVFKEFSLSLFDSPPDCLTSSLPKVNGGIRRRFEENEPGTESM